MEELNRLKILHQEEVAARNRWTQLRDKRTAMIVNARAQGVSAKEIAEFTGLTTARIYNLVRGKDVQNQEVISPDTGKELARLTRDMEQETAAAAALSRQRNEVAQRLIQAGASTPFLAKTLGVKVDTFRNWVYGKTDE